MNSPGKPLPWTDEVRDRRSPERDRFLESHIDLVRYLALRISTRLPNSVELEDLVHDGMIGLLDAVDKYNPGRGVRFRTYAESRVRGSILDGLRQRDWRPRSVRAMQRNIDATIGELSTRHQRAATEDEIASAMGLDIAAYRDLLRNVHVGPLLSLEDLPGGLDPVSDEEALQPDAPLERKDLIRALGEEIARIPERERRILELYYHEGLSMKEVGAVLGVTESRVCQLHSQAASRLRSALARRLHVRPAVALAGRRPGGS